MAQKIATGLATLSSPNALYSQRLRDLIAPVRAVVTPEDGSRPERNNFEKVTELVDIASRAFDELIEGIVDPPKKEKAVRIRGQFSLCGGVTVQRTKRAHRSAREKEESFDRFLAAR